jgi:hypothetical protein
MALSVQCAKNLPENFGGTRGLAGGILAFERGAGSQARRARSDAPHHRGFMAAMGDLVIVETPPNPLIH